MNRAMETNLQRPLISRSAHSECAPAGASVCTHRRMRARGGSILVIALWSLCLLSTFAVLIGYSVRQRAMLVRRLDERAQLRCIAEAGARRAIAELKGEASESDDVLIDPIVIDKGALKEVTVGEGTYSVCYSPTESYGESEPPGLVFGIVDEERKININKADRVVMERLFRIVLALDEYEVQELAASLVDWRDSDSQLSLPLGSAEDSYYRELDHPYEAKDADVEVMEEVLLVKGMTPEMLGKVRDYITIYGDGKVNINTASKAVLMALGLKDTIADRILAYRRGKDGVRGTTDDNRFETTAEIVPVLSEIQLLGSGEIAEINAVVENFLCAASSHFMIRSIARLPTSRRTIEAVCVADRAGKVLCWQEP